MPIYLEIDGRANGRPRIMIPCKSENQAEELKQKYKHLNPIIKTEWKKPKKNQK